VSSIINQSRYIVIVPRKPEFAGEFPHTKAAEAEAYKAQLLAEKGLKAERDGRHRSRPCASGRRSRG
jgi:hypothetical protein